MNPDSQPFTPGSVPGQAYTPQSLRDFEFNSVLTQHKKTANDEINIIPRDVFFESQNPNERIFLYMRRHWSENIGWIVKNIFYSLIPPFIVYFINLLKVDFGFISTANLATILLIYYSFIFTTVVRDFFDWYFDPYFVTNERLIHYEFKPFTRYEVKETMLESVQKIEEKAGGISSNLYNYGTLIIRIEGPGEFIEFKNIKNSTKVRDIISDLVQIAKKYSGNYR